MPFPAFATSPVATYAEYLNLAYRPDLQMVVLRWLRDASLSELQVAHHAALELALHHKATFWFVDVRRRLTVNNMHTRWVTDDFLPQAAALLPADGLRVAYLMSPNRQRIINSDPDMQPIVARALHTNQSYRLRVFLDEASAMAWLLDS
ncbi:hypothetical protein [uncultured Hymenobacter sp.]|uniref:hypothetical protein n=1 Tax=uncultured Hymenobacter sp. TaxID=170016 RepID=UPI0035CC93B1